MMFIAIPCLCFFRLELVKGDYVGLGRSHEDVGVRAVAPHGPSVFLEGDCDLSEGVHASGDALDLELAELARRPGEARDGLVGGVHGAVALFCRLELLAAA